MIIHRETKHLSSSRTLNENRLAIDLEENGGMRVKSGEVKEHSSHPPESVGDVLYLAAH